MGKRIRLTLDELSKTMDVISKEEQRLFYGGYDENDCVWRCLAYIYSDGKDYSADAAMNIAKAYWGEEFDEDNYVFTGSVQNLRDFVKSYSSGYTGTPTQILMFDPNTLPGWEGEYGKTHAVIVKDYTPTDLYIFDPQTNKYSYIPRSYFIGEGGEQKGSFIKVRNYGTNY